ncbi:two component, sigma54 specific, transcriptional regulator, Fis family [Desulfofarcimen acetoxidans DSM 771]|jgi:two-component system response regulator AtoC|uniref:Stage 0 sporulation protein A homolog n=1 Tax=Desulfofarcimen acetoxidans (strain ATCC 49208 / DSM 771 / KCTC 5769 / VKM B-1644 / 5575) TaxID=485916 RepID=C8W392_DESAS|nr:sigma-54 dependent transcriptional regulator [Desulfofarcimen acetoxidans]ACV61859.1 two component, sigma54 specific, transcriptional regulator, Fis family [Desulfofarcimen acetoxidans DSM 771]
MSKVLIVDDEEGVCEMLKDVLEDEGFEITLAYNAKDALKIMETEFPDTVLLDIRLPDADGIEVMDKLKQMGIEVPVILMTAFGTTEIAIQAMKQGAHDYLNKPLNLDELVLAVQKSIKMQRLVSEVAILREELDQETDSVDSFIGQSRHMQDVFKTIGKVVDSDITVLIQGESGTGKEVVARTIHSNSRRSSRPFIKINCATIPEQLMESELFGHEKGSFTGAVSQKAGKFEIAHNGIVFLDEIGELPLHTQAKLLRVLQEKEFERVGGTKSIEVDVRILAATNRNLEDMVQEGKFREDLYYRLNVVNVKLPPLRERKEDISLLINYFVKKFARKYNKNISGISQEAMIFAEKYAWPGNVREIKNVCEQAVVMARNSVLMLDDMPLIGNGNGFLEFKNNAKISLDTNDKRSLKDIVAEVEKQVILKSLNENNWNRQNTAKALGLNRRSLYAKMKEYDLL